jgi:hypothetical protein
MNYKIRITAENQAIVKRIADENGMNKYNYLFKNYGQFYTIINNEFDNIFAQNATELTTEQFIELFNKKESLVGRWFQALEDNANYSQVIKSNFYQICHESDRVIHFKVPHYGDSAIVFGIDKEYENKSFKLMPKDFQPTQETDFKSKVIELIEKEMFKSTKEFEKQLTLKQYSSASQYEDKVSILDSLLNQIKQL